MRPRASTDALAAAIAAGQCQPGASGAFLRGAAALRAPGRAARADHRAAHLAGCQNTKLRPLIDGAPNFRQVRAMPNPSEARMEMSAAAQAMRGAAPS